MPLTKVEYKEIIEEEAPEKFNKLYLMALTELKKLCKDLDEENEIVKKAIAFQIEHIDNYGEERFSTSSFGIGKFNMSGGAEPVSLYSNIAIDLLLDNGICSLWIGVDCCGCC